ncbi:hypothetical protein EIP86_006876 [Pleurotus ostreatoroseus]|nr:hypothetical protein EIP86_006876 [Pleurotus ostreatoroseus]
MSSKALALKNGPVGDGIELAEEAPRTRHPTFYIDDQLTVFQVEHTLFQAHRYHFSRESGVFREMFCLPSGGDVEVDGCSDEKPLVLLDVTVQEFEALLRFFYEGMHNDEPVHVDHWTDLLSISTRFAFDRIRTRAIAEIIRSDTDAVSRISLAQKFDIPSWLPEAYADVVRRIEPLTVEEARAVGLGTAVLLMKAREVARKKCSMGLHKTPAASPITASSLWTGVPVVSPYEPALGLYSLIGSRRSFLAR